MMRIRIKDAETTDGWIVTLGKPLDYFVFEKYDYELDGVVYEKDTQEFRDALEKENVWYRLGSNNA